MRTEADVKKKGWQGYVLVPRWFLTLAGGLAVVFLTAAWAHSRSKPAEPAQSLTVRKLVLVDAQGHPRMVLAAPLPNPQVKGKVLQRSRYVYGIQLLDADGNEVGGVGVTDDPQQRLLCFDWATAEALCIDRYPHGASISIQDEPKPDAQVGRPGPNRIRIRLDKGVAQVSLADGNGKERISLSTGPGSQASLQVKDENGKPIFQVPQP